MKLYEIMQLNIKFYCKIYKSYAYFCKDENEEKKII